jgi:hypothetical protein
MAVSVKAEATTPIMSPVAPPVALAACPSQTVTWLTNCSGTVSALSPNNNTSVANTATGYTGSVTETCNNGNLSQSGASCTASCGGTLVGGFCWYFAANQASCTTTCGSHGGYNSATLSYAGSGGTDANCQAVATAFSHGATVTDIARGNGVGCYLATGSQGGLIRDTTPTTANGTDIANTFRFCACNN